MKKMRNDNKGFTLVEMIVVLVILAILAAILVPALLGYIDEAKNSQLELHGKSVYTAAQGVASKMYAKGAEFQNSSEASYTDFTNQVKTISEFDTFGTAGKTEVKIVFNTDTYSKTDHNYYTVKEVYYTEDGTNWVALKDGSWDTVTAAVAGAAGGIDIKRAASGS